MLRAVVLSDTHLRDGGKRRLPEEACRLLSDADVVLHAGDVVDAGLLDALSSMAPTFAVLGNNDRALTGVLPLTRELDLDGVAVAMVHDSGARQGRALRLHRMFPVADLVVFGHSHVPVDEAGIDGQRLFNPGSPTQRRASPHHSVGVLEIEGGRIHGHRIVNVDGPPAAGIPRRAARSAASAS